MLKKLLILSCLAVFFNTQFNVYAQAIISYGQGFASGAICQPLYPSLVIDGVTHKSLSGNCSNATTGPSGIKLQARKYVGSYREAAYNFAFPFLNDHYYRITITAAKSSANTGTPLLAAYMTLNSRAAVPCDVVNNQGIVNL